jgi:hypothetical protein
MFLLVRKPPHEGLLRAEWQCGYSDRMGLEINGSPLLFLQTSAPRRLG